MARQNYARPWWNNRICGYFTKTFAFYHYHVCTGTIEPIRKSRAPSRIDIPHCLEAFDVLDIEPFRHREIGILRYRVLPNGVDTPDDIQEIPVEALELIVPANDTHRDHRVLKDVALALCRKNFVEGLDYFTSPAVERATVSRDVIIFVIRCPLPSG
jgi:hypothetical protein